MDIVTTGREDNIFGTLRTGNTGTRECNLLDVTHHADPQKLGCTREEAVFLL